MRKNFLKRILYGMLSVFLLVNIVAFFHAWKFTHFTEEKSARTNPAQLSWAGKMKALLLGVDNPRPENDTLPARPYKTVKLQSNKTIECWEIKATNPKGTVIIFHGYGGQKSSMLDKAEEFIQMGYSTLLVDFMGSGGSEGNETTVGYKEAEEVKTCFEYLQKQGEKNIVLFGTSLGAVAILKSMQDHQLEPASIIVECPYGSLYETTCARFRTMGVPSFPMAGLLVFWGGVQGGFWAFSHEPTEYAKSVKCPALLLYGEKDDRVSRTETDAIYANFKGRKELKLYPLAGHENYLHQYRQQWQRDVKEFLSNE